MTTISVEKNQMEEYYTCRQQGGGKHNVAESDVSESQRLPS